jgi:hypothetical protein
MDKGKAYYYGWLPNELPSSNRNLRLRLLHVARNPPSPITRRTPTAEGDVLELLYYSLFLRLVARLISVYVCGQPLSSVSRQSVHRRLCSVGWG